MPEQLGQAPYANVPAEYMDLTIGQVLRINNALRFKKAASVEQIFEAVVHLSNLVKAAQVRDAEKSLEDAKTARDALVARIEYVRAEPPFSQFPTFEEFEAACKANDTAKGEANV